MQIVGVTGFRICGGSVRMNAEISETEELGY